MHDATRHHSRRREPPSHHRRAWCCSFTVPPHSPENPSAFPVQNPKKNQSLLKPEIPIKSSSNSLSSSSFPNSPQNTSYRPGIVTRIDPRRILSPGRVSPIDPPDPVEMPKPVTTPVECEQESSVRDDCSLGIFDVRLNLKGKNGSGLVLELSSEVLSKNSCVFADLIAEYRKNSRGLCRIEVPDVENLGVFRDTIELMFEEDIARKLIKVGAYRAIDVLEVSAGIKFNRSVLSCLKYLEAVPWTEEEEEKLRNLFDKMKFNHETARDISARLYAQDMTDSQQTLSKQLVWSVTTCVDANSRNELKSLVKGLLCKSSVYEKDCPDLNKVDIFAVCLSCINSLVSLLEEATTTSPSVKFAKKEDRPLIDRISKQVDNIIWLLEILLDHQMAEDLVDIWTKQGELLAMHKCASPLVRYSFHSTAPIFFMNNNNMLLLFLSIILLLAPASYPPITAAETEQQFAVEGGKVLELDESNFDAAISKFDHILVDFYAPWCGHCKRLAPQLDKAARILADLKQPISIAKIDADKYKRVGSKYDIDGYPTIKIFMHGVPTDYYGPRKADLLVRFLKKFVAPDVAILNSDSAISEFVEEAGTSFPIFIGFGLNESAISHFAVKYKKRAWFSVSKDFSDKTMEFYDFDKVPALVARHPNYDEQSTFYGPFEEKFIEDYIKQSLLPLALPISEETLRLLKDDERKIILTILEDETDERANRLVKLLKAAASANRDFVFVFVGFKQWEGFAESFEVSKKTKLPKMVVWDGDEEYFSVVGSDSIEDEDQGSQITRFIQGYKDGNIVQKRISAGSFMGFVNSMIGVGTVTIIVFVVAVVMIIQSLKEEPLTVGTRDEGDYPSSSNSQPEARQPLRSGEKQDKED